MRFLLEHAIFNSPQRAMFGHYRWCILVDRPFSIPGAIVDIGAETDNDLCKPDGFLH